jgi:hypothetical protein
MPPEQSRVLRRARLRRIASGLPVLAPALVTGAIVSNGTQEHASVLYYLVGIVAGMLVTVASATLAVAGKRLADRSFRPRPRWLYLLFAAGYAVPVAAIAAFATVHAGFRDGNGWEQMASGLVTIGGAVACLLMLGRALAWGRLRSAFYVNVPQWLAPDAH